MEPSASSRRGFFALTGVAGLAAFVAACGDDRTIGDSYGGAGVGTRQFGQGDAGIVAFALFLERLETKFYEGAIASGKLSGRALELFRRFGAEETAHVKSLEGALTQLGGKEPPVPEFAFVFENQPGIVETAAQLEVVGAGTYLGQARRIQDKKILAAALSIHSVEARHAAALAQLAGRPIAPDGAFASPVTSVDLQSQVQEFINST
jgi:rubrerythrin